MSLKRSNLFVFATLFVTSAQLAWGEGAIVDKDQQTLIRYLSEKKRNEDVVFKSTTETMDIEISQAQMAKIRSKLNAAVPVGSGLADVALIGEKRSFIAELNQKIYLDVAVNLPDGTLIPLCVAKAYGFDDSVEGSLGAELYHCSKRNLNQQISLWLDQEHLQIRIINPDTTYVGITANFKSKNAPFTGHIEKVINSKEQVESTDDVIDPLDLETNPEKKRMLKELRNTHVDEKSSDKEH